MRSIPLAMTWEVFARGRWSLLATALLGFALPALVIGAFEHVGVIDIHDQNWLIMHLLFAQLNAFLFGAAIFASQGRMSQLYSYPASTQTLVAWRMLPALVAIGIESLLYAWVLNTVFHLTWPLWGPALFFAVAIAAVQAAVWLADKSLWSVVSMSVAASVIALWFKSRYGPMFSQPSHLWLEVTPSEILTMLAIAVAAYAIAVFGVGRNRRGEPPLSLGIVAWLTNVFDTPARFNSPFRSPIQAQFWFEWRRKGWIMPAGTLIWLTFGFLIWLVADRRTEDLFEGVVRGGGLLLVLAFVGSLVLGHVGPNGANHHMGQFLATRPITSGAWARIILRTAGASTLMAWSIWMVAVAVVYASLAALGALEQLTFPKDLGWSYLPGMLLGTWIIVGIGTSISLAGRPTLFLKLICASIVTLIGHNLVQYALPLSREAEGRLDVCEITVIGACDSTGHSLALRHRLPPCAHRLANPFRRLHRLGRRHRPRSVHGAVGESAAPAALHSATGRLLGLSRRSPGGGPPSTRLEPESVIGHPSLRHNRTRGHRHGRRQWIPDELQYPDGIQWF